VGGEGGAVLAVAAAVDGAVVEFAVGDLAVAVVGEEGEDDDVDALSGLAVVS